VTRGTLKSARKNDLAANIRKAIGAGPDEVVEVSTPQFTRHAGEPGPAAPPADIAGFEALRDMDEPVLLKLGLRMWGRKHEANLLGEDHGPMLYLFPGEWYPVIPKGFMVVSIMFEEKPFEPGVSDDDIRFGCLPYGILRNAETKEGLS